MTALSTWSTLTAESPTKAGLLVSAALSSCPYRPSRFVSSTLSPKNVSAQVCIQCQAGVPIGRMTTPLAFILSG
jgi:hypothetical protein